MSNNRIVFIHSLNNYSGSPKVLSILIFELLKKDYNIELITSKSTGFLSNIDGVKYRYNLYKWCNKKIFTLIYLLLYQIQLFFIVLFYSSKNTIFYINTITPFTAVWACRLSNKKMIYHVHELMTQKKPFYGISRLTYKYFNTKSIFVSQFLKDNALNVKQGIVIHNCLDRDFVKKVKFNLQNKNTILMIASLRRFKGVYEFVEIAKQLPKYNFELVLSASKKEVELFINETKAPQNLIIFSTQTNLGDFYSKSKILLQLSHPDEWIETFGLTILEAMYYGTPSIVPNIGGPTELVDNNINGFLVDTYDIQYIIEKIKLLMKDDILYQSFSKEALKKSMQFNIENMVNEIENFILS